MRYVDHVLVLGDPVTNDGIAATLLGSGLVGHVATGDLEDDMPADGATVGLFLVHGGGKSKRREAAIRRIRRLGSPSPVVELSDDGWQVRVGKVGKGLLAAALDNGVSGEDLVAVLDLVIGGFSVVSRSAARPPAPVLPPRPPRVFGTSPWT